MRIRYASKLRYRNGIHGPVCTLCTTWVLTSFFLNIFFPYSSFSVSFSCVSTLSNINLLVTQVLRSFQILGLICFRIYGHRLSIYCVNQLSINFIQTFNSQELRDKNKSLNSDQRRAKSSMENKEEKYRTAIKKWVMSWNWSWTDNSFEMPIGNE